MNCSQTQHLLHAYLDGELDLVRHLEIEHHLADCAGCTEAYESHRALHNVLASPALYARTLGASMRRARSRRTIPWFAADSNPTSWPRGPLP